MNSIRAAIAVVLMAAPVLGAAPCHASEMPRATQLAQTVRDVDEFVVVDCRLPPRVRRLGGSAVYQLPGRLVRLPARECAARGGEYTLFDPTNIEHAVGLWLQSAESGDPEAQTNVATLYEKAEPPRYDAAARWYRRAAEAGYGPARVGLGRLYELGLGVEKDAVKAFNLYRQAAGIAGDALELVTSAELAGLRTELRESRQEVRSLRAKIDGMKAEIESLDKLLTGKAARATDNGGDVAVLRRLLANLKRDYASRVRALDEATERLRSLPPPWFEVIYPRSETRGQSRRLRVRARPRIEHVVIRVVAESGLDRVMADGRPVAVDDNGYFLLPLSEIHGKRTTTVVAIDLLGRETSVDLMTAGPRAVPKAAPRAAAGQGARNGPAGRRDVALVIGNSRFEKWGPIDNAERDARSLGEVLERKYGFEVRMLLNASRRELLSAFNRLRRELGAADRLLVFYAGHGHLVEKIDRGYWIPVDAEIDSDAQWVLNDQITDYLQLIPARQILVIADSCYSGAFTRSSIQRPKIDLDAQQRRKALARLGTRRVRAVMSSGGLQPVLDSGPGGHSVFAGALLDVLADNDGALEANRLFDSIYPVVARSSARMGHRQTPTYRAIKFAGHEGGDFIFVPRK